MKRISLFYILSLISIVYGSNKNTIDAFYKEYSFNIRLEIKDQNMKSFDDTLNLTVAEKRYNKKLLEQGAFLHDSLTVISRKNLQIIGGHIDLHFNNVASVTAFVETNDRVLGQGIKIPMGISGFSDEKYDGIYTMKLFCLDDDEFTPMFGSGSGKLIALDTGKIVTGYSVISNFRERSRRKNTFDIDSLETQKNTIVALLKNNKTVQLYSPKNIFFTGSSADDWLNFGTISEYSAHKWKNKINIDINQLHADSIIFLGAYMKDTDTYGKIALKLIPESDDLEENRELAFHIELSDKPEKRFLSQLLYWDFAPAWLKNDKYKYYNNPDFDVIFEPFEE